MQTVGFVRLIYSRSFWAALLGVVGIVAVQTFGVNPDNVKQLTDGIKVFVTILIGKNAVEDYAINRNK